MGKEDCKCNECKCGKYDDQATGIHHEWHMVGDFDGFIYETADDKKTIYRRPKNSHPADDDFERELVFGTRDLGVIWETDIKEELESKNIDLFNSKDDDA